MDESESRYSDAVLQAVAAGNKIEAIKRLREETGLGLKEAKDEIDRLARTHQPTAPPPMAEQGGAGSVLKIAVVIIIVLAIYQFLFAD